MKTREDELVERALENVYAIDDAIDRQFDGQGQRNLGDRDFAVAVMQKLQQFPPRPLQFPDGSVRFVSPFLAALAEVEGGRPMLHRIKRLGIGGI